MRKSKKQLMKSGIAELLIASMAVGGGTLAYLTDSETTDNTFTVGKVKISLLEPNYPGNDSEQVKDLVPNEIVKKDPQVQNTGINDAIIYLKVEVPKADVTLVEDGGARGDKKVQDIFTLKNLKTGDDGTWMEIRKDDSAAEKCVYVFAYRTKLAKDAVTTPLFDEVQLKNVLEKESDTTTQDIKINAYAIQADNILDVDTTTLDKATLEKVYDIYVNQSGDKDKQPGSDSSDSKDDAKVLGTITYDLDGGTLTGAKTEYTVEDYGYTPPTPTRKNYTFDGWEPASLPDKSNGTVTFKAKWSANALGSITYNLNGGTLTGQKVNYTVDDYGYTPPKPTKKNYTFVRWTPASIQNDSTGTVIFTANWTANELGSVTYNLDGGTLTGQKTSYTADDYGYIPPAPTKPDYKFTGWEPSKLVTGSSGNVVFTAKWEANTATLLSGKEINVRMKQFTKSYTPTEATEVS